MFGNDDITENTEVLTFERDLKTIQMCVDASNYHKYHSDFEGFIFTQYDDVVQELTPECPRVEDWIPVDLTEKRLIGFKVIESDYIDGLRNIRSI